MSGIRRLYAEGKMPLEKVTETFTCYIGMLKHTDSQALIDKLYEDMVLIKGGSSEKEEKEEFVPVFPQEYWDLCYGIYGVYGDMLLAQQM